jgi:hypothetical protein
VPDAADRRLLDERAPHLPAGFFDVPVPVPDDWEPAHRGYLRLSPAYDEEAAEATRRGWRVSYLPGRHLDVLSRADDVARAVLELLEPLQPEGRGRRAEAGDASDAGNDPSPECESSWATPDHGGIL